MGNRKTICLLIDRRSTLALLVVFLLTYSTEIFLVICGTTCIVASYMVNDYSYKVTARSMAKLAEIRRTTIELQLEIADRDNIDGYVGTQWENLPHHWQHN
jgi:hypothetical protein